MKDLSFKLRTCSLCLLAILGTLSSVRAQAPDRTQLPELGPPPSLKLPPIQRFTLSNGMPVVLLEKHQIPLAQINLLIHTGSAGDPPDKPGLASITFAMLDEGAGNRDALELADAIDFLGAGIGAAAGTHTSVVTLNTPLSKLDSALVLFADIALRPTFPKEELERQRKQRLTSLLQWHDEPSVVASVLLSRTLFGTQHPYGTPSIGTEQSIRSFTVDDLKGFYSTYVRPGNATLIVVGDVTKKEILPRLEKLFGNWKDRKVPKPSWPDVAQVKSREIFLVDKPGAAQSEVLIGRIGVSRLTPDYYPLVVMNTILGGSFSARLNRNLRETHGYSYGARSSFSMQLLPGRFVASAAVQTEVTDKALVEFMKELNAILEEVTDEELTRAKNYEALSFPGDFETTGQVAGKLAEMVVYNLPDDYFNNYIDRILAVSKGEVRRVANKYIDPEKVSIVIVGDREKILASVEALNYGPISLMTIEDVLGKKPVIQ